VAFDSDLSCFGIHLRSLHRSDAVEEGQVRNERPSPAARRYERTASPRFHWLRVWRSPHGVFGSEGDKTATGGQQTAGSAACGCPRGRNGHFMGMFQAQNSIWTAPLEVHDSSHPTTALGLTVFGS